ncbi:amino acid adenylation domain-containing protein [Paraburkholderia phymatum]|uniref:Amino acid adenylation domain-containing protein n=1 Tax=Paraburkholderia phymatum TaxID=148447 RepID=A0ACC6U847_9BURK
MSYIKRPLSRDQMGLWLHHQKRPTGSEYNLPVEIRANTSFNFAALRRTLHILVDRHEMLRTTFHQEGVRTVQHIHQSVFSDLHIVPSQGEENPDFARSVSAEARTPFDLENGPLFRTHLFIRSETEEVLLFNFHHIITDGYSIRTFLHEFGEIYRACCNNTTIPSPSGTASYEDFVSWQDRVLTDHDGERMWSYWQKQLAGHDPDLALPTDRPRTAHNASNGSVVSLDIEMSLIGRLEQLAKKEKVTLATVLLAAYYVLLHRYCDQDNITLYVPRLGRPFERFSGTFGYFVTLGVLPQDLSGNPIFLDFLQRVHELTRSARKHEYFPLTTLLERLKPSHIPGRNPLAQAVFNFIPEAVSSLGFTPCEVELSGIPVQIRLCETDTWIDLDLRILVGKETVRLYLVYNSDLWDQTTIEGLAQHYRLLLNAIADAPAQRIGEYNLITREDERLLLNELNDTTVPFRSDICLHKLIEGMAVAYPENIAVSSSSEKLSYAILDQQANTLARHLISKGIGLGHVVGVLIERSGDLIVSFLAVLKAGAVYLPLDPRLPAERLGFMMRDAGAAAVITVAKFTDLPFDNAVARPNSVNAGERLMILLDRDRTNIARHETTTPFCPAGPSDLAYIIYTSGSTGKPKGVQIEHRSASNMAEDLRRTYQLGPDSRVLQFASCGFDASIFDFLLALSAGGRLCLPPPSASLPGAELVEFMRRESVNTAGLTPTAWASLPSTDLPDLTVIKSGGEPLPSSLIDRWGQNRRIFNSYGPTEATVYCIRTEVNADGQKPPIGRPAINTKIYILDRYGNPVPVGAVGELYIGGVGVARGYVNRDELTRAHFIQSPFDNRPQSKLYKTGDQARYRSDGMIEFIGRKDEQVKIRGMRVELGEIEQKLMEHEYVKVCGVTLREGENGSPKLTAYIVGGFDNSEKFDELRAFLRTSLPSHMIPSQFVVLPQLPTTNSGKIDKRALPDPIGSLKPKARLLPTGRFHSELTDIWKEVLTLDSFCDDDNFFDVGGDSLAIVEVQARIRERLGIDCKIVDLFEHSTIRKLAAHLATLSDASQPAKLVETLATSAASEHARNQNINAVAIIGMAGRFPGADDVDQFWNNLVDGIESITDLDEQTLREAGVNQDTFCKPNYVKREGVISGFDVFDAAFFGISPKEASWMDPQQRILLETAYHALENAGYGSRGDAQDTVGVFAGVGANHYAPECEIGERLLDSEKLQVHILNSRDFTATRLGYKLNLTGPCVSIQTACSTSLVAVHLACQSLRTNECNMALAGGASISLPHGKGYRYQQGHILSPDGRCRAFDAKAQGTVRASGAAVVVLKRLTDACRDGDYIWAVIKGSAINNDGAAKVGFTAPSADGQATAIQAALTDAGVSADTISYVEAHGTGTYLGDPIEIAGLTKAFRLHTERKQFCAIGSVKSNIGHLDAAAGVTGLIKLAIMLKKGIIPASLHVDEPNPNIDFENSPMFVNKTGTAWPKNDGPRRGGISSFGIGGTNGHAILEESPPMAREQLRPGLCVFPLSAASTSALTEMIRRLSAFLRRSDIEHDATHIAYTLQQGRAHLGYRACFVGSDIAGLVDQLDLAISHSNSPLSKSRNERRVVFMFSGQGEQQIGMGRQIYTQEPVFREAIDECAKWINEFAHTDFRPLLYCEPKSDGELDPQLQDLIQPVMFATQYAIAKLLISWGILPAAVVGHSIGEYAAAHIAGVISLPDAIRLTLTRGRLTSGVEAGGIIAVNLSPEELQRYWNEDLSLAAVNGPRHCIVSGGVVAVTALHERLQARSLVSKQIYASHAVHSSLLDPILPKFRIATEQIDFRNPQIPFMSTVTGDWVEVNVPLDGGYWVRNLRETVKFNLALDRLVQSNHDLFIEIGPGSALTKCIRQHKSAGDLRAFTALSALPGKDRGQGEHASLLQVLGELWTRGVRVDWSGVHGHQPRHRIPLPSYPFDSKRHWIDAAPVKQHVQAVAASQPEVAATLADRPEENGETHSPIAIEATAPEALDGRIAAIFRAILGLDDVALTDGFFDLGGDSLSALSVINCIQQITDKELSVSLLLQYQTPKDLAKALSTRKGPFDALVPIQTSGSRAPVFCPHPFGGHVMSYIPLANALGKEQPLFGLKARGLDGEARPHLCIPEMARDYIDVVKSVQPNGPYQFVGLSMGGSIAWEMACQLRNAGDEVALLALLDTKAIHRPDENTSRRHHHLLGDDPIPEWLSDDIVTLSILFPSIKKHWRKVKFVKPDRQIAALLDFGREECDIPEMNETQIGHLLTVANANRIALYAHTPQPYDCKSVLFAAERGLRVSTTQPQGDLGWRQFALGGIEIHEVPGNHYTMTAPPHVSVLASKLNSHLMQRSDLG